MQFSVLMSVYFREKAEYLDLALESVLIDQTYKPSELILVADGQLTDELYAVIRKYQGVFANMKLVQLPQNVGLGKALNEGLRHCTYEWVARMDSDDIAKPYRFEKQFKFIRGNSNVDVVGAWIEEFQDHTHKPISIRIVPEIHSEIISYAQSRNPISHPVVVFNKNSVLNVGGYEHCPFFEDYWLWIRMLNHGMIFHNIQESLLLFRANNSMYERRGGFAYMRYEFEFLQKAMSIHFISRFTFLKNVVIRTIVRIIPNKFRAILYSKALRKKS